jgi:HEAT repeat protein
MNRLLGLRSGEGPTVGLAVSTAFFSSAGLMIAQSGIDALFFARYGVQKLPVMYLLLGGVMFAASIVVGALLARVGRGRAFVLIPLAIGLLALVGRVGLAAGAAWLYAGLWLLRGAAEFIMGLAVWGLAGIVTDTRQAKRFFPLIGGGAVLGQVLGGLATRPLATAFGAGNLILVWAGTLGAVVILARRLVATPAARASARSSHRRAGGAIGEIGQGFRYVRRSALMRWMAVGAVLFSLLFFSMYLPFSRAATTRYPSPDKLAGFFGLFFGLSTAGALLISLLVTNRLLARFGVPTVMLVLPVLYVTAFGTLAIRSTFAVLAAFRFAQIVWMQGGASSAWEAVINTVPAERRDQTRAFLYGGPTQVGTVLAGVIALVGQHALSRTTLYAVGLFCAALATLAMYRVSRAYSRELVLALREGRPSVFGATPRGEEPFGLARGDASSLSVAVAALSDPDPRIRRLAAHILGDLDASEAEPALVRALHDDDADVRATSLRSLARGGSASLEMTGCLSDPDPQVRLAALESLQSVGAPEEAGSRVRALLHDLDPAVRARAAAFWLRQGDDLDAQEALVELMAGRDAAVRAIALRALAEWKSPNAFELALSGLTDPVVSVRAEGARALAAIDPERALDSLIAAMADTNEAVRDAVAEALGTIGAAAIEPVIRSISERELQRGALSALERLPLDGLASAIDGGSDERLSLLKDSLLARSEREARTSLRAVALLGDRSAISMALESLTVADPTQRANALEVIESVGDSELVRPLLALWESTPAHAPDPGWLEGLRHDSDDWIRACADLVAAAGEEGSMTQSLATLPLMERVMFLRRVPLFSGLPPPDLKPIALVAQEHVFADGDRIADQGDVGDAMHIIVTGDVSIVVTGPERGERILALRSAGDVIGEMAVITSQPRMAALVAKGPVRLLTIGQRQFESILRERPETSLAVMRVLCQRLAERLPALPSQ